MINHDQSNWRLSNLSTSLPRHNSCCRKRCITSCRSGWVRSPCKAAHGKPSSWRPPPCLCWGNPSCVRRTTYVEKGQVMLLLETTLSVKGLNHNQRTCNIHGLANSSFSAIPQPTLPSWKWCPEPLEIRPTWHWFVSHQWFPIRNEWWLILVIEGFVMMNH